MYMLKQDVILSVEAPCLEGPGLRHQPSGRPLQLPVLVQSAQFSFSLGRLDEFTSSLLPPQLLLLLPAHAVRGAPRAFWAIEAVPCMTRC